MGGFDCVAEGGQIIEDMDAVLQSRKKRDCETGLWEYDQCKQWGNRPRIVCRIIW